MRKTGREARPAINAIAGRLAESTYLGETAHYALKTGAEPDTVHIAELNPRRVIRDRGDDTWYATADTQEMATQIAKACNPYFFHFPIDRDKELPSYGFAFTPADIERGPVYEFRLNHVVEVDDPMELVRTVWLDLAQAGAVQ